MERDRLRPTRREWTKCYTYGQRVNLDSTMLCRAIDKITDPELLDYDSNEELDDARERVAHICDKCPAVRRLKKKSRVHNLPCYSVYNHIEQVSYDED